MAARQIHVHVHVHLLELVTVAVKVQPKPKLRVRLHRLLQFHLLVLGYAVELGFEGLHLLLVLGIFVVVLVFV